jgi:hypothetical protein
LCCKIIHKPKCTQEEPDHISAVLCPVIWLDKNSVQIYMCRCTDRSISGLGTVVQCTKKFGAGAPVHATPQNFKLRTWAYWGWVKDSSRLYG